MFIRIAIATVTVAAFSVTSCPSVGAVARSVRGVHYTATVSSNGRTAQVRVRAGATIITMSGRTYRVPGAWDVATMGESGPKPWNEGGASKAPVIVLVERGATELGPKGARSTTFAVVDASLPSSVKTMSFDGRLGFDAISPDGRTLFVVESRSSADIYVVRSITIATSTLNPGIVFDKVKGEALEMYGRPLARVATTHPTTGDDEWILTLYDAPGRAPFIHALNASRYYALCVDLPAHNQSFEKTAKRWSLSVGGNLGPGDVVVANSVIGRQWTLNGADPAAIFALRAP